MSGTNGACTSMFSISSKSMPRKNGCCLISIVPSSLHPILVRGSNRSSFSSRSKASGLSLLSYFYNRVLSRYRISSMREGTSSGDAGSCLSFFKGFIPVSISKSRMPKLNQSTAWPYVLFYIISGAMYSNVPTKELVRRCTYSDVFKSSLTYIVVGSSVSGSF